MKQALNLAHAWGMPDLQRVRTHGVSYLLGRWRQPSLQFVRACGMPVRGAPATARRLLLGGVGAPRIDMSAADLAAIAEAGAARTDRHQIDHLLDSPVASQVNSGLKCIALTRRGDRRSRRRQLLVADLPNLRRLRTKGQTPTRLACLAGGKLLAHTFSMPANTTGEQSL
jgi:hypothetical protein